MSIRLSDVTLRLGDTLVLDGVTLDISAAERRAVMGPSGSGKSTLLRVVAGLERPDTGRIEIDGVDVSDVPPHLRRVGLMFQDNALFPHMDVGENVAYGLRMHGVSPDDRKRQSDDLLELVGLGGFGGRNVASLSGGEAQRVALARTLAPDPRLLLFDEPMAAIDQARKDELIDELKTIVDDIAIPSIYVTHDRIEAEAYAQRISVLGQGRIVRTGPPAELWEDPRTPFVARLMGRPNVVPGSVIGVDAAEVVIPLPAITVVDSQAAGSVPGTVSGLVFRDGRSEATVHVDDVRLRVLDPGGLVLGQSILLRIDPEAVIPLAVDEV